MSNCRICKSSNLTSILDLGEQYLSEFRDDDKKPPKFPLELVICNDCKQVQLRDTAPQNLLYTDNYGYRSAINKTMRNHLQNLVAEALIHTHFMAGDDIRVADLGANDGTLLKCYPTYLERWGFDLVPKFAKDYEGTGINFTTKPFGSHYVGKFKIITAISMFYDLNDPITFMQLMAQNLESKGLICIQQNYLLSMLQINGFDNVLHEHIMYHSVRSMQKIADKCGLDIFDVQVNDLNGGSFRTYLCHKGDYKIKKNVQKQLLVEQTHGLGFMQCYYDFKARVNFTIDRIRDFLVISQLSDRVTYIAGASTRGNTLLQSCGITTELCPKAIERNPEKYGRKIASCGIPIVSEEEGLADKPDYLLVLPFFFKLEFLKRYRKYMKNGGKLIFPLPKLEIVEK